jgi:FdhE protein
MTRQTLAADVWTTRRHRAADLAERWPFAAEMLGFYGAVLEAQRKIHERAVREVRLAASLTRYIAEAAVPPIRTVAVSRGPERLARGVAEAMPRGAVDVPRWAEAARRWLSDQELPPVDRFLVRAAAEPVLRALDRSDAGRPESMDERRCPRCGGPPQLSLLAVSGEDLVAPHRVLECARCAGRWGFPRMTCPACGEDEASRLPIFTEEGALGAPDGTVVPGVSGGHRQAAAPGAAARGRAPRFHHLAIHGCRTCGRYLLSVDTSRDAHAVPVVDEMGAIPLDLYAQEEGLRKIVPNLMGL